MPLPISRRRIAVWLAWACLAVPFAGVLLRLWAGDANQVLFAINSFSPFLYLPIPLVGVVAWVQRSRPLGIATAAGAVLFFSSYGILFVPRPHSVPEGAKTFRAMEYNVLGFNEQPESVVGAIRKAKADIVALQELNPMIAGAIRDELATEYPPLLLIGDLNATDKSGVYKLITAEVGDSWVEAGWGFGHTFPGALSPGSSRQVILGIPVPKWLVRIDYVFHSRELEAVSARVGPEDGVSDHRPVVVDLAMVGAR